MDQRRHQRVSVRFHSTFSSVNRVDGDGRVLDLSLCGCGIITPAAVHAGTILTLRIDRPDGDAPLTVQQAVVRWCRDGRIGLEFVTLQPDEWVRLQTLVKDLTRQPYERINETQDDPGA
ncbi:MAG: PilZ domain-containing protein [Nitrospira sp.]|nr:PilZ domain-containing protein [Nitrospira sp.]